MSLFKQHKSVRLLVIFQIIAQAFSFALLVAACVRLLTPDTTWYWVRMLLVDSTAVPGLELTYASPVAFGSLTLVPTLTMIGMVTVPRYYRVLVIMFIVFQMLLIIIEFPVSMAPAIMLNGDTKTQYHNTLRASLDERYIGLPFSDSQKNGISLMWDRVMLTERCCGIDGATNFLVSYGSYASQWYAEYRFYQLSNGTQYRDNKVQLPLACCQLKAGSSLLTTQRWAETQFELLSETCPLDNLYSHAGVGCESILYGYLVSYTSVIAACTMILLFLQAFATGAAIASINDVQGIHSNPKASVYRGDYRGDHTRNYETNSRTSYYSGRGYEREYPSSYSGNTSRTTIPSPQIELTYARRLPGNIERTFYSRY